MIEDMKAIPADGPISLSHFVDTVLKGEEALQWYAGDFSARC